MKLNTFIAIGKVQLTDVSWALALILKKMNWITILGIVVIGIGTALTYYGSTLQAKKDQKELNEKLDSFDKKLENVISKESVDSEDKVELEEIRNEFQEWAQQFSKNKEEIKLNYRKSDIDLEEKKIQLNKVSHQFYSKFFDQLSKAIDAISQNSNSEISITRNVPLPSNVFEAEKAKFEYQIKFSENTYWLIKLFVYELIENDNVPSIEIFKTDTLNGTYPVLPHLSIRPSSDLKNIRIQKSKDFALIDIESKESIADLDKEIREIVTSLIEFQLISLEKD